MADRRQIVRVKNFRSYEIKVISDVPQWSHLGPLFFNIYINDINSCFLDSDFVLFADDLKFYRKITISEDCSRLQADLNRLITWCDKNGLALNVKKCHSIAFSRNRLHIDYQYRINNSALESVT